MRNAGNGSPLRACAWTGGAEESGDVRSVDVGGGTPFARRVPRLAGFAPEPEAGAAPGAAVFKLPPIRREVLPNGLTVLALPRPGTPSLALRIFVDAGLLVEPEAKAGVAKVVSELLLEGTARRTGREIADAIEFVGGSLDASPTGVTGKVLWRDGDLLLDLAADALQHPVFPADAFARVREQTLSEIEGEEDHPATVGRNLFYETIYGAHPMHRPSHGYKRTVEALTRDDAVAHHAAFCRPRNAVVAVVGDAPPEALIGQVRRHFGGWADNGPAAKPSLPEVARQTEPKAVEKKVDSAQAHIYVGHLGIRRNDPDYHALLVMDQVLGLGAGFTDRLSKRVRDELGLAYQVYGTITHTATVEPGPFQIYAGTRPQKKDEAVREIQATLKRFVDEGPTGDELREVKAYLLGSYVFEYETASSLADYLISVERFGLGLDYLQRYPGLVAAVTRDDVVRVAKKHLDPASLTTVVVWRGKAEESKETR